MDIKMGLGNIRTLHVSENPQSDDCWYFTLQIQSR